MDHEVTNDESQKPLPPRRRTAYACISCRARKVRCDGEQRCASCRSLGIDCQYHFEATSTKGKSDLILSSILRVEQSLSNIDLNISTLREDVLAIAQRPSAQRFSPASPEARSRRSGGILQALSNPSRSFSGHSPQAEEPFNELSNATIPDHTSTTEAILHWPIFDSYPELRRDDVLKAGAIFWMENARQRHVQHPSVMPFLSEAELDSLVVAFGSTVNFSYPIVSQQILDNIKQNGLIIDSDYSTKTCITLLVLALGCAAETVTSAGACEPSNGRKLMRLRQLGRVYFDAAISRLHVAYCAINAEAALCLALTALYYAYLQRPIQAWSMLSSTATACRVIMSYNTLQGDDSECVRRIFWMCFILESDYLAELPNLPHFGIGDIESKVPLPGQFMSHDSPEQVDLSSLYFLACISMRRLLNRCHHLLFGQQEKKSRQDSQQLAAIVSELDQQLENWRRLLPPAFQFSDTEPVPSQHGAFLRQRYLTCRALIHRPYVMHAISDFISGSQSDLRTIEGARKCLESCILHIMNLRPFAQTVIVDMWICSLSMAGTMMILLIALKTAPLTSLVVAEIYAVGPHLCSLLETWADVHGEGRSPSVQQAVEWIKIVDSIIQQG